MKKKGCTPIENLVSVEIYIAFGILILQSSAAAGSSASASFRERSD